MTISLKDLNSYLAGNYLGKQDLDDGRPVVYTIKDVNMEEVKSQHGSENKMVMRFNEMGSKPWILGKERIQTVIDATGTRDPAQWVGMRIEVYLDKTVRNPNDPQNPGGLRARSPMVQTLRQTQSSGSPSVGVDGLPLMTYDEALANCFDLGIKKEDLLTHLKSKGIDRWNSASCTPHVRQLLRMTSDAKKVDEGKLYDEPAAVDHVGVVPEDDIPF